MSNVWMPAWRRVCCLVPILLCVVGIVRGQAAQESFVRISPRDPRYFELSDGRPYTPDRPEHDRAAGRFR